MKYNLWGVCDLEKDTLLSIHLSKKVAKEKLNQTTYLIYLGETEITFPLVEDNNVELQERYVTRLNSLGDSKFGL